MSKRLREEDSCTTTKEVKREALRLVDMSGIRSRYTSFIVFYEKECTWDGYCRCHVSKNTLSWNGFFVNVGLELQENSTGDMSLTAVSESLKISCRPTQEEKAQAATLLYWLLTKHKCVKHASISEDVFVGHEDVVCRALSDSVGVTVVTLMLPRALLGSQLVSSLGSMQHFTRLSVITDAQEAFFPKLARLIQKSPSSTDVLGTVLSPEQRSPEFFALFGDLCRSLHSVCIAAGIQLGLCNLRPRLVCAFFAWHPSQLLTTLQVASPERGPEVDVQALCEAVSGSSVVTQLDMELRKLKEQYATPIQKMLCSAKTLKRFGLDYNDIQKHNRASFYELYVDSLMPQYTCPKCRKAHVLETCRIMPWIKALMRASDSVEELRFSMFAFCTLECRAFLNALSKNTTLKMLTIPRLGQIPSEYCKSVANAGVMDRVTAEVDCDVVYPDTVPVPEPILGQYVNVPAANLGRILCGAVEFGLVAYVHLSVHSVLCLTGETDPAASPLIQLIREAPALATVDIRIEDGCCSWCWNQLAPWLCDAVLQNRGIQTLAIKLPKKPAMDVVPLARLLHRNPRLLKFVLEPPCPEVFGEFLREASKPMLWDNYNLAVVDLKCDAPDQMGRMLRMKEVSDRNSTLAMRAARFVGGMRNSDNARALERMVGSLLLVKKVCEFLSLHRQLALDRIAACLRHRLT